MADSPVPETASLIKSEEKTTESKVEAIDSPVPDEVTEVKEEAKEDAKPDNKEQKSEPNKEEEKEQKYNISDNIIPPNYNPEARGSIAQTAKVPAYDNSRRLSKLEMQTMKAQINSMTAALISDPKDAVRRFTVDETDTVNAPQRKSRAESAQVQFKSHFHTKKDLPPLKVGHVLLGLLPLIFIVIILIFGGIVYGIAQGEKAGRTVEPDAFGDWPNWGGNVMNQQMSSSAMINSSNLDTLALKCDYTHDTVSTTSGANGYIATDRASKNGYYTDESGNVSSINLADCTLNWQTSISETVKSELFLSSRNGVSLFRDTNGNKGVLIGTPNGLTSDKSEKCYIIAVSQTNGNKLWTISLEANGDAMYCMTDGFVVEGQYAYGGIYTDSASDFGTYRGEVIKIDLDTQEVVDRWYSLTKDSGYAGAAPVGYPSIIGDYLVIGTGALYTNPTNVDACLSGDYTAVDNSIVVNVCEEDRTGIAAWECLEEGVNVDAVIVLNKTSFEVLNSMRLQGNDMSTDMCNLWTDLDESCPSLDMIGPGSAVGAQATYAVDDDVYTAVLTKGGVFYVFELPRMELIWAKKIGPSGLNGGGMYSLAIDSDGLIAVASITGMGMYKYAMKDGTMACGTGFVSGIDLLSGDVLWQFVNPFGVVGQDCVSDSDSYDVMDYAEVLGGESCYVAPRVTDVSTNVVVTDVSSSRVVLDQLDRAKFIAPVTVANDIVFIASNTGDVFVLDVQSGEVLKRLSCANVLKSGKWNRNGIGAGLTVVQDRVIVYCGSGNYGLANTAGRTVMSYQMI